MEQQADYLTTGEFTRWSSRVESKIDGIGDRLATLPALETRLSAIEKAEDERRKQERQREEDSRDVRRRELSAVRVSLLTAVLSLIGFVLAHAILLRLGMS